MINRGVPEDESDICVLVMPSCAVGAVIGTKGAKIRVLTALSTAHLPGAEFLGL